MRTIERLRARIAELADLESLQMLGRWDQQVMMPAAGGAARALQLATLTKLTHQLATDERIGAWLEELEGAPLDELDTDVVRLARRDWERARRVPAELAAERSRADAEGHESWRRARASDDFNSFAPALERNVELARAYAGCMAERRPDALRGAAGRLRLRAAHRAAELAVRKAGGGAARAGRARRRALAPARTEGAGRGPAGRGRGHAGEARRRA